MRNWRATLLFFFVWLMVEDLFRKLAGNAIATYFVKDLILLLVLAGFFMDPKVRGVWKSATGRARIALYALIAWAVVMSIPTALTDWRLPLLGLRLDFMFLPLVVVGYVIARDRHELARWAVWLAVITALASSIGLIQATVGPQFLRPSVATPGLINLELTRYTAGNTEVFRPTGTFVEPGRFLTMALVGLTVSLGALFLTAGRRRVLVVLCLLINLAAVWTSGGRTGVLWGGFMVVVAAVAPAIAERRPTVSRAVAVAVMLIVAIGGLNLIAPSLISSRAEFYTTTLDPNAETNEWGFRWQQLHPRHAAGHLHRWADRSGHGAGVPREAVHLRWRGQQPSGSLPGRSGLRLGGGRVGHRGVGPVAVVEPGVAGPHGVVDSSSRSVTASLPSASW